MFFSSDGFDGTIDMALSLFGKMALSMNYPVALAWQLLVARPLVRYSFEKLSRLSASA